MSGRVQELGNDPDFGGRVRAALAVVTDIAQGVVKTMAEVELVLELLPGTLSVRLGVVLLGQVGAMVRAEGKVVDRGGKRLGDFNRGLTDAEG